MLHPASKLAAMLRPRSHRFALESRQLFDGAALVEAAHATDAPDAAHAAPAHAEAPHPAAAETHPAAKAVADAPAAAAASEAPAAAATPHAVYVMDQSVVDWQQVVQALPTGSEVILIDNRSDGVAQLAAALHGRTDISALQIVSHGASGQITLGDSVITADNIAEHAAQWAAIGASLTADGDILLYGCDVAGQSDALLVRMSALTGADVAASADATGAAVKGGNWTLERSVGQVEAQVLNDVDYQGLLAAPTVTSAATKLSVSENSTLNAPGADQATLSGWNITNGGVGNVTVVVQVDGDANGAPDLVVGGLTVGNAGAPAGTLSFTGTAAQATAWVNSLVFKATDVELGNTAARAVIQVRVTDAATSLVATRTLAVTVTPSNDPVTLSSTPQAVGEGADTPLTVATLRALDPEVDVALTKQPSQIVYGVTANPQYGYLTLNGVRLGIGSVFTQQDVIDGDVHYVHTATGATQNQPDSFGVRANDGATPVAASAAATIALTIAPVNQAPTVSGLGVVLEGQPGNAVDGTGAPLSQVGNFIVADGGGDDASSALTVRITGLPTDGTLYFTGTALVNGTSVNYTVPHAITAAELATGSGFVIAYDARAGLTYGNNGTRDNTGAGTYPFVDGFKVIVSDAGGGTGTPGSTVETNIAITVRPVNDDPTYTGALAPEATVTATGNSTGSYTGPYAVTLTPAMLNATDVDSVDGRLTFAVTSQSGLNQGTLLLNGKLLPVGGVFTVDDVINGRVQYVQTQGAAAGDIDTFQFQVIDNTIGVRWNADGTSITRVGGVYDLGDPGVVSDDRLHTFDFTVHLAPTLNGNGTTFLPNVETAVESSSTHAGTDITGSTRGVLVEDGSVVIRGASVGSEPYLSYVVEGVPPSQVVYTILGLTDGGADWNGAIQRQISPNVWVDLNVYDTFTQADLNANNIRYQHDGTSEDFQATVRLSASAGILVNNNGTLTPDNWDTTFTFYVTPTNDAPVVVGSSNAVVAENGTVGITSGMLQISDPDDATSEARLEGAVQNGTGSPTLPNGGGDNFAYNNDATGANALRFRVTSLPPGGTLEYLSGTTWVTLTAGTLIDASLLTNSAGSTGLRFVSDGSEVRSTSFNVEAVDRWGQASNSATVRIQITNVNDAPQIAATPNLPDPAGSVNDPLTGVTEGSAAQITPAMLSAFDPDSSKSQVQYTVTRAPAHGSVALSTDGGTTFKPLGVGSSFTQADVDAGRVYYVNNGDEGDGKLPGSNPPSDSFGFSFGDGDKEQPNNEFWIYTVPANDAPVVSGPTGPIAVDSAVGANNPVPGFAVADAELDTLQPGETDFLQVTVRLLDAGGNAFSAGDYTGVTIGSSSLGGVTVDGNNNGAGDFLTLRGTRAEVNAALAGLTVTFSSDRDAIYQVQVIADDRLRDEATGTLQTGANGGLVNDSAVAGITSSAIPSAAYDWYSAAVPTTGDITGNISAASVRIFASSVNDPAVLQASPGATVVEDQTSYIGGGFVVADAESGAFDLPVTVTLSVPIGTLGIGGAGAQGTFTLGGGQAVTITGDNTGTLTLTGRASDIETLLNSGAASGLTYSGAANVNHDTNGGAGGDVTLTVSFEDTGSRIGGDVGSGSVAANPPDVTMALTITPVNDAPTVTLGGGATTGTPVALVGGATPTPVPGFLIGDIDIDGDIAANGAGSDVSDGEADYLRITVRITDSFGVALTAGAYTGPNNITIGSTASGTSGATVDAALNGTGSALVISGTRAQVQAYLVGLQVALSGSLANSDQSFRVEVIADDRLRDGTGAVIGAANGGLNNNAGNGTVAPSTTAVDPYAAIPGGLTNNVASTYQTLFPSSVNDPATIAAGNLSTSEGSGSVTITGITVTDQDAVASSILTTTVSVPAGFTITGVGAGTGGSAVIAGDGLSVTLSGTLAQINSRINTIAVQLPDAPSAAVPADWNGAFTVTVVVDDEGNTGGRPATLAPGDNATTGTYAYQDGVASDLVTTRTFSFTVNPLNDAPVVVNGTTETLAAVTEDVGTSAGAATVGALFGSHFADAADAIDNSGNGGTGGSAPDSFFGVAINGLTPNAAQGEWQYSLDGSTWTAVGARSDTNALVLASTAQLRFVPAANFHGAPNALTVRLVETDTNNDSVTLDPVSGSSVNVSGSGNGGTTLYSAGTVSLSTSVTNVNDRPTGTNGTLPAGVEDVTNPAGSTVTALFGAGYSDATDNRSGITGGGNAASAFGGIAIVGNTAVAGTQGTWEYSLNGTTWLLVPTNASDAAAVLLPTGAQIRFVPVADFNGTPGGLTVRLSDATVTAVTSDISATVGLQTSQWSVARTLNTTIAPRNDAPVLGGTTGDLTVSENAGVGTGVPNVTLVSAVTLADLDLGTTGGLTGFGAGSITVGLGTTYVPGDELFVTGALPAGVTVAGGTGGANLVVTFDVDTTLAEVTDVIGRLTWRSTSDNPTFFGDAGKNQRTYTVVVNDGNNQQVGGNAGGAAALNSNVLTGTITITPVNDGPVANNDARSVAEDAAPITGNVIALGGTGDVADTDLDNRTADLVVTSIRTGTEAAGTGTVGTVASGLAGSYGTLVLNANGSYSYTVDNGNPVVNALKSGQTLTETYTYALSDGAGGTDTAQLTITIQGRTDGAPSVSPVDGNGGATGQATVFESGLTSDGPGGQSQATTGAIALSALDGLASATIGGTTLTLAQLQALSTTSPSAAIDTGEGSLVLTGFTATTTAGIVTGGSLSYTYTLKAPLVQTAAVATTDTIALVVTDASTATSSGTLTVQIVDDTPTANADTNSITEDATVNTVSGNVVTTGGGADRVGADATATPVSGISFNSVTRTVGTSFSTAYGSLVLNADGSYTYTLDNGNAAVNALKDGQTLTEVVNYTITDRDGDTSTATLTLTVNGHTDGVPAITPVDGNGPGAAGEISVLERGLVDGIGGPDTAERTTGTLDLSAPDGLNSITIGGTPVTLAQLQALSTTNVTIDSPDGTIVLTGFAGGNNVGGVPTTGQLSFSYTLKAPITNAGGEAETTRTVALVVTDAGNASSNGTLTVRIVDDVPTANADSNAVTEDGPTTVTGNVVTTVGAGQDSLGADGAALAGPVTAVSFGATSATVGAALTTAYGTLTLNANGSYSYVLDNGNPAVNALQDGQTLTEVVNYTITDRDGDSSSTTLTITINGHTDGAPSIGAVDGNGGAAGQIDVLESGLTSTVDTSESNTGSVTIVAGDGLASITVGGSSFTLAQLQALGTTPQTVDTPDGTIVLTGFTPTVVNGIVTGGALGYSYTLKAAIINVVGEAEATRNVALSVTDAANATSNGTLTVRIVDDVPIANADTNGIAEDATVNTVSGNVVTTGGGADRVGADATATPVSGISFNSITRPVGTSFSTAYGSLVLNADGSYTYTLDNGNAAVNALKDGDTLTEVVTYTITDGDGDTSTATLTLTVNGHTDGVPAITPVDGNGPGVTGQATVHESGLTADGPATESASANGVVTLTAPDGLRSFQVEGTSFTLAQLQALATTPQSVDTGEGLLVLTAFTPTTVGGLVVGGDVAYSYTLKAALGQPGATASVDTLALSVTDAANATTAGTLTVQIVDDVPAAQADVAAITEDGTPIVSGNVVTAPGTGLDRLGADGAVLGGPVTAVAFGATVGSVGSPLTTTYGSIVLNADGSYTYTLDNNNAVVNALKDGETLTEVVSYTITDSDGDTSNTTLTITVNGRTDAASGPSIVPVDNNGAAAGATDVFEHGLTSPADASEATGGTIAIAAADGLQSVSIGGTPLTLADLAALSPATPVVIQTPQGTLTLTGFVGTDLVGGVPTRGTLTYSYTLDGQVAQPGATESTDPVALVVTDAGNATSTGTLTIRIVDDVPFASADTNTVSEDGVTVATGNVRGNDTLGADAANGVPVTGVAFGGTPGTVGSPLATAYGSIVVHADGSYSYTLDNAHPAVQRLVAGETLTETVTYTITDADGDTSVATLTLTVQGRNDVATLQIVDGNGGDIGQATVNERGLGDSGDTSETTTGAFVIATPDGLGSVQVGGVSVTPAQLAALGGTPVVIATPRGTITLTGFDASTGALAYRYTLSGSAAHGGGAITDDIAVTVTDRDGDSSSGTLRVRVIDDVPTARNDAASLGIALPNATVGGNVFGTGGRGPGDVADRLGADVTPTPVSGFSFNGVSGVIGGAPLAGAYGTLQLRADGSYVYAVNDRQQAVAALGDGKTLTEVFSYTITDADGSTSTAQLVITIRGASPARPLTGDQIFPVDYPNENRRITQGMQPALFVQLAVRWSERLSEAASAAIATRVAGGDATYGADDIQSETLRIPQDMGNVQHVSRDGVAFSLRMLADLRQSLAMRGLGAGLPDGANALFGDFPGFTVPAAEGDGSAPSAAAAPGAERIVVPAARPHADARDAADAVDAAALGALAVPGAQASVDGARSFSQRLALAAGERGSVRDLVRMQQQREAVRVKVKQVTL